MENDYSFRIRRIVMWTIFILAGAVLGWGISSYQTWFAGLALGIFFGMISAVFTAWKIHKVGEIAIQSQGQKKRPSLGTPTRFAMAALSTLITLKFPAYFHLAAMVIGLMVPSVIAFIDMLYFNLTERDENVEEGGE